MKKKKNRWFENNVPEDIAQTLIKLSVTLPNNTKITRDFRPDLDIEYEKLEFEMAEMPSIFGFWSLVLAEQKASVMIIDRKIKTKRAETLKMVKEELQKTEVKLIGRHIDEIVDTDDAVKKLEIQLVIEKKRESKLYAICDSLKMKAEILRSLAGFKKQELIQS